MRKYIQLMRPKHYIKNGLIFAALVCSGLLFEKERFLAGVVGFAAFSLVSSVVYIVNDIRDREKDMKHPTKRNRPLASGTVSVPEARALGVVLVTAALGCNGAVFHVSSTILLILYLGLNIAYSFGLKNQPLVDVTILTAGFLIRVSYGAVITGIVISDWLWLTVIATSLYFSLGKRRNELQKIGGGETRTVLDFYTLSFLDKSMYMCLGLTITFYALWCIDVRTTQIYGGSSLIFTVPIVLLITLRYSMDIEDNSDGDPVEVLLCDKLLLFLCGVYFMIMFVILYFVGGHGG